MHEAIRDRGGAGPGAYQLIGESFASSTTVGQINTVRLGEDGAQKPIAVLKGDMVGFTFVGKAAFGYDETIFNLLSVAADKDVRWCERNSMGGPHMADEDLTWNFPHEGRRAYYVMAVLQVEC